MREVNGSCDEPHLRREYHWNVQPGSGDIVKVLVIEDEGKTAAYLLEGLTDNGFSVDVSANGRDGLHMALTGWFDLIILDVMLPERDGWSVLRALREAGVQTPVLFLTARDAIEDRVKGLVLGA